MSSAFGCGRVAQSDLVASAELVNSFRELDEALAGTPRPDNPIRKARALLTTLISNIEALSQDFEQISLSALTRFPRSQHRA